MIVSHAGVMHALLRVALDVPDESALGITFVPAGVMRLTGAANVLIMPAIHSASISTKLVQAIGGATVTAVS